MKPTLIEFIGRDPDSIVKLHSSVYRFVKNRGVAVCRVDDEEHAATILKDTDNYKVFDGTLEDIEVDQANSPLPVEEDEDDPNFGNPVGEVGLPPGVTAPAPAPAPAPAVPDAPDEVIPEAINPEATASDTPAAGTKYEDQTFEELKEEYERRFGRVAPPQIKYETVLSKLIDDDKARG